MESEGGKCGVRSIHGKNANCFIHTVRICVVHVTWTSSFAEMSSFS